jgi:hypothetical protein
MSGGHVTRPTDWWVLDLERDPTPGSPTEVRRMARRWHEVSEDAAWAARRMSQLMGDGVVGRWIGEAGDVFRARSGELPGQLAKCADSYGQAADALSWWADRLDAHQADADSALARGRVARDDLERALADARRAAEQVASSALVPALVGPSLLPSPEQVHDAQARLASAKAARSQADAAVADAESRLEAARRLALDALELRERDGRTTAARIHEAADAGIPERSRWDKLKDWADEAWHVVVEVAKVTVAVLGVVALLLGGPLAWVVLAAAVVLLADAIRRWMRGEAALWEVGLAALGCIPGAKGVTSAAELSAFFSKVAASGQLRAAAPAARAWLAEGLEVRRVLLVRNEVGSVGRGLVPRLSFNQMNLHIRTGRAPKGIVRVDLGRVPNEQPHVHFADGSALNIDGTWKHGLGRPGRAQRDWLAAQGWRFEASD